ncbi:MAG: hypothetical protein LUB59_01875 [Candidatus Gastranaerophilales bacterium]|nr:hypothetical protein [Candidatus Gastranaerophilales bacterium]
MRLLRILPEPITDNIGGTDFARTSPALSNSGNEPKWKEDEEDNFTKSTSKFPGGIFTNPAANLAFGNVQGGDDGGFQA